MPANEGSEVNGFSRALVLEDDERLCAQLCELLNSRGLEVVGCDAVERGLSILKTFKPDLLLLDFSLRDGDARALLSRMHEIPCWPTMIAISGHAESVDAFEMARAGVRAFLPKPVRPDALLRALAEARSARDLRPALREIVGEVPVYDAQQLLRETMLTEAMARTNGSRTATARLLKTSRQLVQQMIRAYSGE